MGELGVQPPGGEPTNAGPVRLHAERGGRPVADADPAEHDERVAGGELGVELLVDAVLALGREPAHMRSVSLGGVEDAGVPARVGVALHIPGEGDPRLAQPGALVVTETGSGAAEPDLSRRPARHGHEPLFGGVGGAAGEEDSRAIRGDGGIVVLIPLVRPVRTRCPLPSALAMISWPVTSALFRVLAWVQTMTPSPGAVGS